ncbi:family 78 glycoside hydrolase catalytic domain [Lentzea tibetensis]|uniref:family 78 glycoside hydrolase catalytic domain n=1 Tax=Lentzea tibetensis TaxID=2591470 RepID=UPI001F3FBE10|nr:family 78 glycoside hydrolase catalytic domain [Lentzea tibetensis]
MRRRDFLKTPAVGVALSAPLFSAGSRLRVTGTTVEYADALLGTDVERPRLSWVLAADGTGVRQTAYEIEVDGWSSGKVDSGETVGIAYGGPALRPRTRYHWRVRVWDGDGCASEWSERSWWETGLLGAPWQARWIGAADASPSLAGASWIWSGDPVGTRWFRGVVTVPDNVVTLVATADDDFTLFVDGREVLRSPETADGWKIGRRAEVTGGRLVVAARVTNRAGNGGFLLRLGNSPVTGWKASATEVPGWEQPGFDDGAWPEATVLHPYGQGPWGSGVTVEEDPGPLLRKEFVLAKPVSRARLYISGMAYHETEINGLRVGDRVLEPGFTDYDRTVLYSVHDVTSSLRPGGNAIGVALGRGFYGMRTPNVFGWERPSWHGEPRLLAQLEISHPDGTTTTVASDGTWRVTAGPTRSNSLYTGETYDARLAPSGWTSPGFDDREWEPVVPMAAPKGVVRAQEHEPIRVVETVTPAGVSEPSPGVVVADMGRTMSGWTRITVDAPAGTVVRLLHGETLNPDGTVRMANRYVTGPRQQLDEYVCGGARETWEPRFSYKGFRYVQVTGARPVELAGRVVHSDVRKVSAFRCSEPLFERYDAAMRRTVTNNLHDIPTDTPVFEKNGWTGDAQLGAPSMLAEFGMARFLTKWIGDLADSQEQSGQLPLIVPSGGWGGKEMSPAPEWTTVYPFLLREMYRVYADTRVAERHWPALVRYLDWEIARLRDGLAVTALGDYHPPGVPGVPPEDTRLTATTYLYRGLVLTAELGEVIGKTTRYRSVADGLLKTFNATFLDPSGHYRTAKDPGYRQTSNAVPLAFGMVPPGSVAAVAGRLADELKARGNRLDVGCLGAHVLLQALSDNGYADLAHAVAAERAHPSWGYWFDNGADTMWEMWDTATRSRNHYYKGTVVEWLYTRIAGLRPGDAGFRTFTVRPEITKVSWARMDFESVRGRISVAWSVVDGRMRLTVEVPVGSTAEIHVPGSTEAPAGARHLRTDRGYHVFSAPQGRWTFG